MALNFVFYHTDNLTLIDASNPIEFGRVDPGITSDIKRFHIWNDKDLVIGAELAVMPRLSALSQPDDVSAIFAGTALNGFKSMLEARSCRAVNVIADQQTAWTPISETDYLTMGDMTPNSMREIEVRLRVPIDSPAMTPEKAWQLRVSA